MIIPDERELLAGLRPWVELESPTGDAAAVSRMTALAGRAFGELGMSIETIPGRDGAGDHVSAKFPGRSGPTLLVLCHLDTVHPSGTLKKNPFRIEGDCAWGPGIYDMKGGVYIAYRALRTLVEAGLETPLPLHFLLTSDEETGSATSRELIERAAEHAKYVLVTEPARGGGKCVTGRRGVSRYWLRAHGRAAHSGVRHSDGRSAVREIANHILALEAMTDEAQGLTVNVGTIEGGTTLNTVPEHCLIGVDVRSQTPEIAEEFHTHITSVAPYNPDVRLEVSGGINRPAYTKTNAIGSLLAHAQTLASDIGFELEDMHTGGGSDGSFVARRVATLDGIGVDGAGAHTEDEHIYVSSLVPRMTLLRRLFETLG